ncbi:FAD/NAD(P)-binding domain-containing protein [Hypoxylon trugodes]|uniref:FAD/NAD(P)-binding domain-containing protein n=1 Tax=Hypoxylon trugodes TaxID=326681 RepID=UPI00218D595B|nr:FAD/NAD(P)-binding domain-containing protein [Hypoxylon trugodes]KAI1385939.1 FAD/NAD(P)-binding domain-containing protein [Hypoxylon trugodes]
MAESQTKDGSFDFDVIIIGAGISGINTAYYLHSQTPWLSYTILEGRSRIGGTWDLFNYPGIRSDSDMTTFGFSWNPWNREERLGTADQIRSYMRKSAAKYGIDKNIRCDRRVLSANWSTKFKFWTLIVADNQGVTQTYRTKFIVLGTGYYNYDKAQKTTIPGLSNFTGTVVHPQFWPEQFDYSGKDVVVVGSGATAVTLIPSIAEKAKSVTMLQRSPGYIVARPMYAGKETGFIPFIQARLPSAAAKWLKRIRVVISSTISYFYCIYFPEKARLMLRKATIKLLPESISWNPHFNPQYNPWRQRMCLCPDGDFYAALRSGKANVVTDQIETVTSTEIQLKSGRTLQPDVIITATGLQLQFAGGIEIEVDGQKIDYSQKYTWKGTMIQDIPNLAFVVGYANSSWTMGAEAMGQLLVRVLRRMKKRNASMAVPRLDGTQGTQDKPVFDLSSNYVKHANQMFPRAGNGHWDYRRNYLVDILKAQFGDITKGLQIE